MSKCVIAGVFDPFTNGHKDLVERASNLFDTVVVAVADNNAKNTVLSGAQRVALIQRAISKKNVVVEQINGLLADYCRLTGADCIVKGVRNQADFAYECDMSLANRSLAGVETLFLPSTPTLSFVSSSFVKDVLKHGGDIEKYIPSEILSDVLKLYGSSSFCDAKTERT